MSRESRVVAHGRRDGERRNVMHARISSRVLIVARSRPKRGAVALTALLVLGASALAGCASSSSSSVPLSAVAITDFGAVAGRWTGPLTAAGRPRRDDDWIDVTIARDGGYAFAAQRSVAPFVGTGRFTLKDGKLVMGGEQGRATFTLLQVDGGRQLRGDALQP